MLNKVVINSLVLIEKLTHVSVTLNEHKYKSITLKYHLYKL